MESDGATWFWRIFGGAIIGFLSLLLLWALNTLGTSVSQVRTDVMGHVEKFSDNLATITAKVAALEEFREAAKEKTTSLESGIKERAEYSSTNAGIMREKDKEHDAEIVELRERVLKLEERLSKMEKTTP